jgi:DNA-directed RNA polymerase specialized sigma24 family protein
MELLERFVRDDLDAFESIFREYQNEVYGWIVRIVRDPDAQRRAVSKMVTGGYHETCR